MQYIILLYNTCDIQNDFTYIFLVDTRIKVGCGWYIFNILFIRKLKLRYIM